MDWIAPLHNAFWAGLYASALALAFTAPVRALPVVLAAGFAGRFSREVLTQLEIGLPMATALAALAATVLAVKTARDPASVPVAAVTAVLPLGPTSFIFYAIRASFDVFAKDPAVADAASAAFMTNSLKAVVVVAAMGVGTSLPLLVSSRDRY
jgi:uncharacterized membrane protein YjjB (DUF3815 family)